MTRRNFKVIFQHLLHPKWKDKKGGLVRSSIVMLIKATKVHKTQDYTVAKLAVLT